MSFLVTFFLLVGCFVALVLAFFALSSCLGDQLRAAWSGRSRPALPPTTYGLQYARSMGNQVGWESIEMEDMLDRRFGHGDEDDDNE